VSTALVAVLSTALALAATVTTPEGDVRFDDFELQGVGEPLWTRDDGTPDAPVLAGTTWCPRPECVHDCLNEEGEPVDVTDCFVLSADGGATVDGACVTLVEPGTVTLTFTPQPCGANAVGFDPVVNTVTLDVIAAEQTHAVRFSIVQEMLPWFEARVVSGTPIDDMFPPLDDVPVYAGAPSGRAIELYFGLRDEGGGLVVYNRDEAAITTTPSEGARDVAIAGRSDHPTVTVEPGDDAQLSLSLLGRTLPLARVRAVAPDAIDDVTVEVFLKDSSAPGGFSIPVALHAVARDTSGDVVIGLPATWDVTAGALALFINDYSAEQEHVFVQDACLRVPLEPSTREATVTFDVDATHLEVPLSWQLPAEADVADVTWPGGAHYSLYEADETFRPGGGCRGDFPDESAPWGAEGEGEDEGDVGCACASGRAARGDGAASLAASIAALCALAALRPRRPRGAAARRAL
jgi:hypothetical protein